MAYFGRDRGMKTSRSRNKQDKARTRVLHICNWYPSVLNPKEGPFIERHVKAVSLYCDNEAWHIGLQPTSGTWRWTCRSSSADRTFAAEVRCHKWRLIEWVTYLLVVWAWFTRDRSKTYDVVVLHIAYPLAVRFQSLQRLFRVPIVLAEQWSAYHFSFHTRAKGLRRIRSIFDHEAPLICVSRALLTDIEVFSGIQQRCAVVIDNVAETTVFHMVTDASPIEGRFFAIANWRSPKRPLVLIEMMARLRDAGITAELRFAGGGPLTGQMNDAIIRLGLGDRVSLIGHLDPAAVAHEMRLAHGVLHASDYETYSAVCAESLCCGTPVLASDVGGIGEYLSTMEGSRLVLDNDPQTWAQELRSAWVAMLRSDRQATSARMMARASTSNVGLRFSNFLDAVVLRDKDLTAVGATASPEGDRPDGSA